MSSGNRVEDLRDVDAVKRKEKRKYMESITLNRLNKEFCLRGTYRRKIPEPYGRPRVQLKHQVFLLKKTSMIERKRQS